LPVPGRPAADPHTATGGQARPAAVA
jgi:hypothetical protein